MAVPSPRCSPVNLAFQLVLEDAWEVHDAALPSARFAKRMRLVDMPVTSITAFVNVSTPAKALSAAALQRREEHVPDPHNCEGCNRSRVIDTRQATAVCARCGESDMYNVIDASFREGTSLHTAYLYIEDHLKRFSARETTLIEDDVLESIRTELRKRVYDDASFKDVSQDEVRIILKRLSLSALYNHSTRIWTLITGNQPPSLSETQENDLVTMFAMLQTSFERNKPKERRNMLSYSYVLKQCALLLGYDEIAAAFKLLKSKEKIQFQDQVWKLICADLGWRYIRSMP
ncbi:poxvirus late transcription factor VLTF3 like-domain-containing protein [Tribonema minus]|uniref:Poxvirus late transcription factor VLTF3 like-domain-containing protein n=1 Tax=Tribonema minus TaxID=303371 RepID=A0A836CC98_9STRA|nr:poxvirus late transcription factor VLTF3 like-domain-containing protein [Tribonema minus]